MRQRNFLFSVAGVDVNVEHVPQVVDAYVRQVVPSVLANDPYVWDRLPNTNSDIQMIRSCIYYRQKIANTNATHGIEFKPWYQSGGRVGNYCWDPISGGIAQIVVDDDCPWDQTEEQRPCLDIELASTPAPNELRGEEKFIEEVLTEELLHDIWLIGNEPDNSTQDALLPGINMMENNVMITLPITITDYAELFIYMYDLLEREQALADMHTTPKLVFCQATYARNDKPNQGLDYCRKAFKELEDLGYGAEHIYALSTHQYMHEPERFGIPLTTYENGALLDGVTSIVGTNQIILQGAVSRWESYLQEFETWAEEEDMEDKPLWLTEFGSLDARCTSALANMGACSLTGEEVFYGRNNGEGIWGMQEGQISYLMREDNQWQAAWWFSAIMGDWDGTEGCDMTVWLWGDDQDCTENRDQVNSAGSSLYYALDCLAFGQSCYTTRPETYIISNSHLPPLSGSYCKPTLNDLCVLPNPTIMPTPTVTPTPMPISTSIPTPTPMPTPTTTNCSCSLYKGGQCLQVTCDQ